jgi:hypothetical protein
MKQIKVKDHKEITMLQAVFQTILLLITMAFIIVALLGLLERFMYWWL